MDGVLIIDKPAGLTSHDVVARVRRLSGERRVGHTGTLDPFATGVLVLLLGRTTRLAQFLRGAEKEYEALVRFGYATDTGDATGTPRPAGLRTGEVDEDDVRSMIWSAQEIESALDGLRGEIEQIPPMYSAKKIGGKKLYELARRGEEIERRAARVTIHELETLDQQGELLRPNEDGTCDLSVRVVCSAGTYIRVLAEDLAKRLGSLAHLASLRRTRAGDFKLDDAVTLDELKVKAEAGTLAAVLLANDAALSRLPFVHLTSEETRRARHGMAVPVDHAEEKRWQDGWTVRMRDEQGNLLAVGVYDAAARRLRPRVVMMPEE